MPMAKKISDIRVVITSLLVSVSDVVLNFTIAFFTGSTVMLSQGLQGLSDLITGGILYVGVRRSRRQADYRYNFGYGREVFFWVLIAGIIMFLGTGALSVYFGIDQLSDPTPLANVWFALIMLMIGLGTNAYSFSLSVRRLHRLRPGVAWWHQLLHSSIVETKATFLIDFLGTIAALFGFAAIGTYVVTGNPVFDGIGSIVIGLSMMAVAILLILDVRDLIVGKAVEPETTQRIIGAAQSVGGVASVLDLRTMYLGSAKILVILEIHMYDNLTTDQIEKIVDNVKTVVQENVPEVHHIQVEVETPDSEVSLSNR
jgi:cation diffusion facilitator family transporter